MAMNAKILIILAMAFLFISCKTKTKTESKNRPNIILLMDDQHRWDALGVVNNKVVTPNLNKLAKEGVRFSQAVCQAPMCIASRNSMMLGLYPNQLGVLRNEPGIPDGQLPNKPLAQLLQENGYETAGFGKTHWGVQCSTRGFETRYIGQVRELGAKMMIDIDPDGKKEYDDETKPYGGGEEGILGYIGETSKVKEEHHRDGWVFNRCLEYINKRNDSRPLFLYLSFLKPHAGHNVPAGYEDHYKYTEIEYAKQPPWKQDNSPHAEGINRRDMYVDFWKNATEEQWEKMTMRYYANCTWIDDMFGRTMEALKQKGLLENAIVVYVSDHGEMLGERYYRFNKYCLYESSVRVPVIISGTALSKDFKGKVDNRPAELVDVYPTILKAVGIKVPVAIPGLNLLGPETRQASFCALHERKNEASFMWRTNKYKLILMMNRKENANQYSKDDIVGGEFYDLKNDPQEWNNLYGKDEFKAIQHEMSNELIDKLQRLCPLSPNSILWETRN